MKKSKRYATIKKGSYEDNPDRRVYCPEWNFYPSFMDNLTINAKKHDMSRSCFFETVVQNFFLLENPIIPIYKKNNYSAIEKTKTVKKLMLHPTILELIKLNAQKSRASQAKYLTILFEIYRMKYKNEVDLAHILSSC